MIVNKVVEQTNVNVNKQMYYATLVVITRQHVLINIAYRGKRIEFFLFFICMPQISLGIGDRKKISSH